MKGRRTALIAAMGLVAGAALVIAGKPAFDMARITGRAPAEAAAVLLDEAKVQAGAGSWERLAIASVYYRSGDKARGESMIEAVLSANPEPSDYFRAGRIYADAGEWPKAKPLFERALTLKPKDDSGAAEAAAWATLAGDREWADLYFRRAVQLGPGNPYHYTDMAGALLGLKPGK